MLTLKRVQELAKEYENLQSEIRTLSMRAAGLVLISIDSDSDGTLTEVPRDALIQALNARCAEIETILREHDIIITECR